MPITQLKIRNLVSWEIMVLPQQLHRISDETLFLAQLMMTLFTDIDLCTTRYEWVKSQDDTWRYGY